MRSVVGAGVMWVLASGCGGSVGGDIPIELETVFAPSSGAIEETDTIIVKYRSASSTTLRGNIEQLHRLRARNSIERLGIMVYDVDLDDTGSEVTERIKRNHKADIEYVEVDLKFPPAYLTNDPLLGNEWHLDKLGVLNAWDSAQGDGVTVANLDTGVNCAHPDLAASCVPGWNSANNTSDSSDIHGHGTMTSGTALSVGNNATGGAGVAFGASLMPIRIAIDSTGAMTCSSLANGIIWAADHGARVASNSYYVIGCSVVTDAANYMTSKGGVYVRAAGNDNTQLTEANQQNIVIVSATDVNDVKTSWSNYGSTVDIAAPGTPIYCTTMSGGYGNCWGTSFSVPIVSGVLALMFSVNPSLTPEQAKSILFSTAVDLGNPGWDPEYGYGRVDADKAVNLAASTTGFTDTIAPTVPQGLRASSVGANQVTLAWNPANDDVAVTAYDVFRDGAKVGTASGTTFTNSGLTSETSYAFAVAARDAAGNVSSQSASVTVNTPAAPFSITSSAVNQKSGTTAAIDVALSAPGTVIISYGTSSSNLASTAASSATTTSHQVALIGLRPKTKYFFRVTATNASGVAATSSVLSFRTSAR